jgi:hypothetical protein
MTTLASALLALALLAYVFYPAATYLRGQNKSRLGFLYERKEVVYENLRDLNFEYKAGKLGQSDFESLRASLEDEAAEILAEIDFLEAKGARA